MPCLCHPAIGRRIPTGACLAFFPGSATFANVDSGIPAAAGHYDIGSIGRVVGEFVIQVAQVPHLAQEGGESPPVLYY